MAVAGRAVNTGMSLRRQESAMHALSRLIVLLACLSSACALAADPAAQPRSRGEAKEMFSADGLSKVEVKASTWPTSDPARTFPDTRACWCAR
jgi:hypothetical protein